MPEDLALLTADIAATAALPLTQAQLLPRSAYTSEAFFAVEEAQIFRAGWLCIAHVSELPQPGDYLTIDIINEPLVITRGKDGAIHVLSRICAHRAMDILPGETGAPRRGNAAMLVCPYHAWSYGLNGGLRGCPHMQNAANFNKSDWPLTALRSEIWNGFVFINFDGTAAPVAEHYADLDALLAPWQIAEMSVAINMEWECAFNWKIMVENWMESYHHIGAHSTTLNPIMPGQNTWIEAEHPHFIHAHLPYTEALQAEVAATQARGEAMPGFLPITGLAGQQQKEWGLFVGYPCFMFLTMPDRLLWYRLLPSGAQRCRLQTITLVSPETLASPDFPAMVEAETPLLRDFHLEDMEMNTGVQKGLGSRYAVRGRLSHLEEPVWLIQRYLAARLQGGKPPMTGPLHT